ncbi:MAG: sugar ABC transporter permease, partial [Acidimicrobiales bacterium]
MIRLINALLAIIGGVGAALLLYWVLNKLVEMLPQKWEERIKPWVFVGVALAAIGLFLIYPAVRTIILSFANATSTAWVGLENYTDLLTSRDFQITLGNTLLWIAVVPAVTVVLGLAVATLADRLGPQGEKLTKSAIFLPLAISGVGAATIWRFIYEARPAGEPQIGLLNAVWTAFGFDPVAWLTVDTLRFNSFLLMVVVIWGQVGFSMVLLSAAVKGVPVDTLEAARIDGANERQIFFKVTVPQIWGTVITVFITVLITTLKAFDIV